MLSYLACLVGGSNCLTNSSSKLTFFLAGAMFIMLSVWAGVLSVGAGRVRYAVLSIRASSTRVGASGRSKSALVITPAVIPPTAIEGTATEAYFPTFFASPKTDRPILAALLGGSAAFIARVNPLKKDLSKLATWWGLIDLLARSKPAVIV